MSDPHLVACHECDLLQREAPLPTGGVARCRRCGGVLYRSPRNNLDLPLAVNFGALILFVIANVYPIVGLEINGELIQATLFGAVRVLYRDGMWLVAGLIFVTTILTPLVQMLAMTYLLLPLRRGQAPKQPAAAFRALQMSQSWGMIEVFILGVLVALVKLQHIAAVVPGVALWSFAALTLLLAATAAAFNKEEVWAKVEAAR